MIEPLNKCLDNNNYLVHSSAALAMVKMRIEVAIEPLVEYLDYPESSVRRMAAYALGGMGKEVAIEPLIKCLDDEDCLVRRIAASALAQMGTEATIDPLIKCLDDDDYLVLIVAAFALVKMGKNLGINKLVKCLNNQNIVVRIIAANILGYIGEKRLIYPLIKCLDDDHKAVRYTAAFALYKIGAQVPIDPLIKCLDDEWSSVRKIAARALSKIGRETTITKLINLLNKEELAATNNVINFYETMNVLNAIQERCQVYNPIYCPKPTPKPDPPKLIATQTIYILHLSDLHITTLEQATLWSNQLAQDLTQDLQIPHLDALILSGDIANYSTPEEYQAAQQFLDNLRQEFPLDPKQIVLVPGNHDLNWELAKRAYQFLYHEHYEGELKEGHYIKREELIGVRDEAKYQQRFSLFSQFYQAIKGQPYPLDYDQQGIGLTFD
ncbi:MAG: hypothetical protein F6K44_25930, partial [Moorea sp. SIO3E2]|nr:hypothetical protein [Moorena sp. SIO3E2]